MNKKIIWAVIVAVVVILVGMLLVGVKPQNRGSLKIGAVLPMSGPAASVGELMKAGLQWKIAELKDAGRKIDLKIEDSQSDPKIGVSAFNKLVSIDGIKIIFTTTSGMGMNLKPLAESNKVLLWGDISHSQFTKDSNYILRHSNVIDQQTRVVADHIISKGFKNVGVLYQPDDFGTSYSSLLAKNLEAAGIKVTSESVDPKSPDYRTQITKVRSTNPDAMVFAIIGQGAGILIKQSKEAGFKGAIYESVGFISTPAAQQLAGDLAKGIYYEGYDDNLQFNSAYQEKFGKPAPTLGVMGYTDVELLVDAIDKTGSVGPEKIISYVKSLGSFQGRFEKVTITSQGDIVIPTMVKVW